MPAGVTPGPVTDNARITLLMTRPRAQSEGFLRDLPAALAQGLDPIISPLIEIAPLDHDIQIAPDDAVIFTSANGVATGPHGTGQTAYCVGPATTEAAQAKGWAARQSGASSADLIKSLIKAAPKTRIWHLAGFHTRGQVTEKLGEAGLNVTHIPLYDQILAPLTDTAKKALTGGNPVIVPLFSPRTARQFAIQAPSNISPYVIVISKAVAGELAGTHFEHCTIADSPDAHGMLRAVENRVRTSQMG